MENSIVKLTRQELYDQVWSTPMRNLAPQYGLSDVGLAKICKRFDIPRPPLGYWAKKEHGKPITQPKLPPPKDNAVDVIEINVRPESESSSTYVFFDSRLAELYAKELERPNPVIPKSIRPVHEIAYRSKQWFLDLERYESKNRHSFHSLDRPKQPVRALGIDVSKAVLDRTVRLIAAIVKEMESRGFRCGITTARYECLDIPVFGIHYYVRIRERLRQVKPELTAADQKHIQKYGRPLSRAPWELVPSGNLELFYGATENHYQQRTLKDSDKYQIEDRLGNLFLNMLLDVDEELREQARRRDEEKRRIEHQRWLKEEEEKRRRENERREKLTGDVESWHLARRIRRFVKLVEQESIKRVGETPAEGKLGRWIVWARGYADELDSIAAYLPKVPAREDPPE